MRIGKLGQALGSKSSLEAINLLFFLLCRKGDEVLEVTKPEPLQELQGVPNSIDTCQSKLHDSVCP
jgi:hypothetical protein